MTPGEKDLYDLLYAISAGCPTCVTALLYGQGVSPVQESKHQKHTAVNSAAWEVQRHVGQADLARFIEVQTIVGGAVVAPRPIVPPHVSRWWSRGVVLMALPNTGPKRSAQT